MYSLRKYIFNAAAVFTLIIQLPVFTFGQNQNQYKYFSIRAKDLNNMNGINLCIQPVYQWEKPIMQDWLELALFTCVDNRNDQKWRVDSLGRIHSKKDDRMCIHKIKQSLRMLSCSTSHPNAMGEWDFIDENDGSNINGLIIATKLKPTKVIISEFHDKITSMGKLSGRIQVRSPNYPGLGIDHSQLWNRVFEPFRPRPNVIIIMTDEHNLKTLGCYRDQMAKEQAYPWGDGVKVDTPHIDSLARDGALFTKFYSTSPRCTPSRGSFLTGLYPLATGAVGNNDPLNEDAITFAELLKNKGYQTSFIGKWHLDGKKMPGWGISSPRPRFGFDDVRYKYNRGHWKTIEEEREGDLNVSSEFGEGQCNGNATKLNSENYSTDFLFDRALKFMSGRDNDGLPPFAMMISIPDPHTPYTVRQPYSTMFSEYTFQEPKTRVSAAKNSPVPPRCWDDCQKGVDNKISQIAFRSYFGMVKLIDDKVGKLIQTLNDNNLVDDTILMFTSDHGALMSEHGKNKKGLPWETSAGVPFIIRYPGHIKAGQVIDKAYSSVDFVPSLLGLVDINATNTSFHGMDASEEWKRGGEVIDDEDRVIFITQERWVAAVTRRYKLVVSPAERPWLYDLEVDPDELLNVYRNPQYSSIISMLTDKLLARMEKFPLVTFKDSIQWGSMGYFIVESPKVSEDGSRYCLMPQERDEYVIDVVLWKCDGSLNQEWIQGASGEIRNRYDHTICMRKSWSKLRAEKCDVNNDDFIWDIDASKGIIKVSSSPSKFAAIEEPANSTFAGEAILLRKWDVAEDVNKIWVIRNSVRSPFKDARRSKFQGRRLSYAETNFFQIKAQLPTIGKDDHTFCLTPQKRPLAGTIDIVLLKCNGNKKQEWKQGSYGEIYNRYHHKMCLRKLWSKVKLEECYKHNLDYIWNIDLSEGTIRSASDYSKYFTIPNHSARDERDGMELVLKKILNVPMKNETRSQKWTLDFPEVCLD